MILNAQKLRRAIKNQTVEAPFEHVNPASIDLTLGAFFRKEKRPSLWHRITRKWGMVIPGDGIGPQVETYRNEVVLQPGETCLAFAHEWVNLPAWMTGEIRLKSTAGRCFVGHQLAVWIDPGFTGRITLELRNDNQYHAIKLRAGDRIVQLILDSIEETDTPYRGKYQGDNGVQTAKAN